MTNGTLSSYFEQDRTKAAKKAGASVSPYSAPADSAGGPAPTGGGSAGGPSAPKAAQGGGTGFVSFGQYFGGNAPAVQAQAQGVVNKNSEQKAPTIPQGASGLGTFKTASFGPQASAGTMVARQKAGSSADPYAAQSAQTSAQFAALNPAAQSGDMGENVGAFDRLLGGGETQRAAKGEQQRLGTLRAALEGQQGQFQAQQAQAQQTKADADRRAKEEKAYYDMMDLERRKAEYAASQQSAADNQSWWDDFMNTLSIGPVRD
jgi:hypothetical protein